MFWKKKKSMKQYECSICGEIHSNWPALANIYPFSYAGLSQEEKESIAEIDSDFCIIRHEDQTDRFVRVSLTIPVVDAEEDLDYGLWVSLSEESFNDYQSNFHNTNHETQYFGWLNNFACGYENTLSVPMTVVTQPGNDRPKIFPHKDHDNQLVRDFYDGITSHEAQKRVDEMMMNL